jgi:protein-disulfide isomerase
VLEKVVKALRLATAPIVRYSSIRFIFDKTHETHEKEGHKVAKQSGGDKTTRNIVIGMVIFVVAVGVIFSVLGNRSPGVGATPSSVSSADGYGITFNGDLKNKPTIDLWEDFQCPVCKQFELTNGSYIQQLVAAKKAKVVYHLLSFIGPESVLAANASACAADENKFLAFHSYLYATQGSENSGAWSNAGLIRAGAGAGLTDSKFRNCVNKGSYTSWVAKIANDGAKKKINATPTLFVNGKELDRKTQYFNPVAFAAAVEGKK